MINLLPEKDKKEIRAARSNLLLLRYNILLLIVTVFLGLAIGFTYYTLMSMQSLAEATIEDNTRKEGDYTQVKSEAAAFRSQLSEAKTVLGSQISYSKVILSISHLIPPGAVLTGLKLDGTIVSAPLVLDVKVRGEDEAATVRNNFRKSPFFSGVTTGKITRGDPAYPYIIELTVTVQKGALR
jgi:hypothetical protein